MTGLWLRFFDQISGGKPRSVAVDQPVDVTDRRCPPLEGPMSQSRGLRVPPGACRSGLCGGPTFEELSGGNWISLAVRLLARVGLRRGRPRP